MAVPITKTSNSHAKRIVASALQRFMNQTVVSSADHGTISLLEALSQNRQTFRTFVYSRNQIYEFRKLLESFNSIVPENKEEVRKAIMSLELSELVITLQPIFTELLQMDGLICKKQICIANETDSGEKKNNTYEIKNNSGFS